MKTLKALSLLGLMSFAAHGQQNTILATTLSAAVTATATQIRVASANGIEAPNFNTGLAGSALYIVDPGQTAGELVRVSGISGTTVSVTRFNKVTAHVSGAMVLVATKQDWFQTVDPQGSCTLALTYVTPWVNTNGGNQWLCSTQTLTWVPSWGNPLDKQLTTATATASVAGATAIVAPLVEISGTEAITSFTMPTGWNGQGFCILPTAAFTTVAGNNIAEATTADANQTLCYVWNARLAAFAASY